MRDINFFLRANYIMDHFKGYFEGAKTFLTPKLSWAQRGTILGSKVHISLLLFEIQFFEIRLFLHIQYSGTFLCDYRKPREVSQFGKKSAKVYHSLYSSTEQLQVALWSYIFSQVRLKQSKVYSDPPSSISPSPISPSLIPPSRNPPSCLLGQFDY
jgi:hypothetical protein